MDIFLKTIAGILISVVLGLILSRQGKDMALLLSVTVCCMIVTAAVLYLKPVIAFFKKLESIGNLDSQMLKILFKAVGIGLLAEITSLICEDSGNTALAKGLQFLAAAVILWISIPLLNELLTLLETILGAV